MTLMKRHSQYHKLFRTTGLSQIMGKNNRKHIKFLKNKIKHDALDIVYIVVGAPGIGKTATCYNVAQEINCQNPLENGDPCGECDSCKEALTNPCTNPDIKIINAAVNNGVDSIKDLIQELKLTNPKYNKICIILDEWHNLTGKSLEALLGVFEDANIGSSENDTRYLFLLPTTSIAKAPAALLSRAQVLTFEALTKTELRQYLEAKCEYLNLKYDLEAFDLIYSKTYGGVRDSLQLLEKIAYSNDFYISVEATEEELNAGKSTLAPQLFKTLLNLNTPKALSIARSHCNENGLKENDFNDLFDLIDEYIDDEDCIFNESCLLDCLNTLAKGRDQFINDSSLRSRDILFVTIRKIILTLRNETLEILKHNIDNCLTEEHKVFTQLVFDLSPNLKAKDGELVLFLESPKKRTSYITKGLNSEPITRTLERLNISRYEFI